MVSISTFLAVVTLAINFVRRSSSASLLRGAAVVTFTVVIPCIFLYSAKKSAAISGKISSRFLVIQILMKAIVTSSKLSPNRIFMMLSFLSALIMGLFSIRYKSRFFIAWLRLSISPTTDCKFPRSTARSINDLA